MEIHKKTRFACVGNGMCRQNNAQKQRHGLRVQKSWTLTTNSPCYMTHRSRAENDTNETCLSSSSVTRAAVENSPPFFLWM